MAANKKKAGLGFGGSLLMTLVIWLFQSFVPQSRPLLWVLLFILAGTAAYTISQTGWVQTPSHTAPRVVRGIIAAAIVIGIVPFGGFVIFKPAPVPFGPEERAYLRPRVSKLWFNTDGEISAEVITTNIGRLQAEPNAFVFTAVLVNEPLTLAGLGELFNDLSPERGLRMTCPTLNNFWNPGESCRAVVSSSVFLQYGWPRGDEVFEELKQRRRHIYVVSRTVYKDKIGHMSTESCFIYKWPDLSNELICSGHNGPRMRRKPPVK